MRQHDVEADTTREPLPNEGAKQPRSEVDDLLLKMDILEPGDHKLVATLLERHPALREVIIAKAQEVCGNETVAKALELVAKPKPAPAGGSATAQTPAASPAPGKAADAVVDAKQGGTQAAEEFDWLLSPLALEYDHAEKVRDHVEFIRKNPQLRDKVIAGAAEFHPELAKDVEQALRGEAPAAPKAAPAPAPAPKPSPTAEPRPADKFEYILSPLVLEYDREEKIKDHVDYILKNPGLREQVLIGAAEFDAPLAEAVRQRLENPTPAPAVPDHEPVPPDAVAKDAEQAAPAPKQKSKSKSKAKSKAKGKDTPAADTAKSNKPESGWVVRARAWQAAHPEYVSQFLELTGAACLDADGKLDPNLVASWQAQHGVRPDGRVGNNTLTAAILDFQFDDDVIAAEAESPPAPVEATNKQTVVK
jgi:peptidoglycan hydrolase-like protein with peptidoglycan-binding domain